MKQTSNDLMEMITVRLYSVGDTQVVHGILQELAETFKKKVTHHRSIRLYKSELVENDWAIYLQHAATSMNEKSEFALSLAEMLKTVGLVNHTLWKPCNTQTVETLLNKTSL